MAQGQSETSGTDVTAVLAPALKNQYHAMLAMFRKAVEQCPNDLWVDSSYTNPFWRIAYHTLYFLHLYIQPKVTDFRAWEHHQTGIQDLDDIPAPEEILAVTELPHRPPQTGEPYTKAQILEYWEFCEGMIDDAVDELDLTSPDSGFSWYRIPKAEHQLVTVRHLQHHTAQLSERLRCVTDKGVDWMGARWR